MANQPDPRQVAAIAQAKAEGAQLASAGHRAAVQAGTILSRVAAEADAVVAGSSQHVDVLIRDALTEAIRALADAEAAASAAIAALRGS